MHWTYETFPPTSDLEQGDILFATRELRELLGVVHPHFDDDKYVAFAVSTQSCDLVRRRGKVGAPHISIAAVRSLRDVLPGLLGQVARQVAPGCFQLSSRQVARQFLERLFDQNEQGMGLFYLHPDADIRLGNPAIVFLRVKVALRSDAYDLLVSARTGRLKAEFRAKYGWLLGNLYARAASPDWSDNPDGGAQKAKLIDGCLVEEIPGRGPTWIEDELIAAGKAAGVQFAGRDSRELAAELEQHRPKPRLEQVIDQVLLEVEKLIHPEDDKLRTLANRLRNNGKLAAAIKPPSGAA